MTDITSNIGFEQHYSYELNFKRFILMLNVRGFQLNHMLQLSFGLPKIIYDVYLIIQTLHKHTITGGQF